jgi:cobalt/nickel transport protein
MSKNNPVDNPGKKSKLWIGLAVFIVLSPLGLLAPGTAWGEWGSYEVKELIGYAPKGMAGIAEIWHAPFPDYSFSGWEEVPFLQSAGAYIFSAVFGVAVIIGLSYLLGRLLAKKEEGNGVI